MSVQSQLNLVSTSRRGQRAVALLAVFTLALVAEQSARAGDPSHDARVEELVDLAAHDASFKVRASATQRLGNLGRLSSEDERLVTRVLIEALQDKSEIVRGVAAHAIGQRKIKDARVWLEKLRDHDQNDFVKRAAIAAIDSIS